MEMEEGSTQSGSDSISVSHASASESSISTTTTTPFSSQGSGTSRGKELRSSKDKCSEPRSRDSHRRRGENNFSKSIRRRSRSKDNAGCSGHRRKTSPIQTVLRSPRRARNERRYREWPKEKRGRSRSRSSSRRRRERSRSSSRQRARRGKSAERGRPSSRSTVKKRSRICRDLSSNTEAIRNHCQDIQVDPILSSDDKDDSPSREKNLSKRFETRVIFVTNLAPEVTRDQLDGLFRNLGRIRRIDLYKIAAPDLEVGISEIKVSAFIKFRKPESTNVAVHLIGFPFLERPLLVFPVAELDKLPDRDKTNRLLALGTDKVIQLIKDKRLNQFLNNEPDLETTSAESPDQQLATTSSADESQKDIQMLLTWHHDWLNYLVTKHQHLAPNYI